MPGYLILDFYEIICMCITCIWQSCVLCDHAAAQIKSSTGLALDLNEGCVLNTVNLTVDNV